jgi:hypothetical protein
METIILNKSPNSGEVYTTEIFNLKHPIPCLEKNTTWVPYKSRFRIVYPNILLGMWADSPPRFPWRSFTTGWRLRWNNLTNQPPFPTTCFAGRRSYDWGRRPQSAKVVDEDTTGEKGQRPCHIYFLVFRVQNFGLESQHIPNTTHTYSKHQLKHCIT